LWLENYLKAFNEVFHWRKGPTMFETPVLLLIGLLVLCGIAWWFYRAG
jgi:hypothetical protein